MQDFERLLDVLDRVVTRMQSMHSPAHDFGTGVPLYRTEIHTIRTIGENPKVNVTRLAELMGVTKGAISQTVNKLAKKGLVRRLHSPDNAREVLLELTDRGWTGFHDHERFHAEMFGVARDQFGDELGPRMTTLTMALTDLNDVLDRYEQLESK